MALFIHKADVDGQTGMLRLKVQAHSADGSRGPIEHIAIYPQALANILGGDLSPEAVRAALHRWMKPRHAELHARKEMIKVVSEAAQALNSVVVQFTEEEAD